MRATALLGVLLSLFSMAPLGAAELSAAALDGLQQKIRAGGFPNLHSVVIQQGDKRVAEWYFSGTDERRGEPLGQVIFNAGTLHDVRSVTKSIVALLFGIARDEGLVTTLDAPILEYFPDHAGLASPDLAKIRLHHVLSMTSGLAWDEQTYPYTDPRNSETAMDLAGDKVRHILTQPVTAPPGEVFRYSGGDVALVGELISRVAKMPLEKFAEARLFTPLGIASYDWLKDATGKPIAASGLRLTPSDMMKIGQLVRDGGRHQGKQLISKEWIDLSLASHTPPAARKACSIQYGYFWWLMPACDNRKHPAWYAAIGNGGQRIMTIPAAGVIVVTTSGNYNSAAGDKVADAVLLAIFEAGAR